jgi:glutamyl/glutaminyl-tRNA synthetase
VTPLPPGAPAPTTRFAPAPSGRLHLGHLANAIYVWGFAQRLGGRVLLRIEDHDRQRCRPEYEAMLLDDLDGLGLVADEPSTDDLRAGPSTYRQSDNNAVYAGALADLRAQGLVYACDCSRTTFEAWRAAHGTSWSESGCPGGCRERELSIDRALEAPASSDLSVRIALGDGEEAWDDALLGPSKAPVAAAGDLPIRDRNGNWTYALCVVVDDLRHGVDLVVRGEDLLDATADQIRLGRLVGRERPPTFAHHPLVRRPDGSKLSKADGDTALGELMDGGSSSDELFGEAAARVGLVAHPRRLSFSEAVGLEIVGSAALFSATGPRPKPT